VAKSIKLKSELWERVEEHSKKLGYSSPAEFVEHVLEKELARAEEDSDREEIDHRLRGLGYIE